MTDDIFSELGKLSRELIQKYEYLAAMNRPESQDYAKLARLVRKHARGYQKWATQPNGQEMAEKERSELVSFNADAEDIIQRITDLEIKALTAPLLPSSL